MENKIGFDKIRALLLQGCLSEAGRELAAHVAFSTDFATLSAELDITDEMRTVCLMEQGFPESGYEDTLPYLHQLSIVLTYYLDVPALRTLQVMQETVRQMLRFFEKTKEGLYPQLKALCATVEWFPAVAARLDSLFDRFGEIRDNASPQLADIRSARRSKEQQVARKIQSILKMAQDQGIAEADASVSVREGRLVIPVAAANKRKIEGFVFDESASGKTSFIEPMEVVNLNNQIRELGFAEQREILRILVEVADFLRPYAPDLIAQAHFLARMDFLRAKARLAIRLQAGRPVLMEECGVSLLRARHPLLEMTLAAEGKSVVPLSLRLDAAKRILLISGPNAGGKSVCLKTVGLLQYMLQCGLLVPASEASEFGLFNRLFIDIGDEQSIENDLSTYSSHLKNMRLILEEADDHSMLLIDEFGSGTEPTAGGALAEAMLEQWEQRGCFGVITTHYTNLKLFAAAGTRLLNGAMQFDVQRIEPLFKLEVGVPGSSFAFEIAQKMGISPHIIATAQERAGSGFVEMEKHIKSIARNRRRWEEKVAKIKQTDRTLESITDKYQTELADIQKMRKQIVAQAKEQAAQIIDQANRTVENTIKEIRESQAEKERTKVVRENLKQFREQLDEHDTTQEDQAIERKMEQLKRRSQKRQERAAQRKTQAKGTGQDDEAKARATEPVVRPLAVGDKVRVKENGLVGEVLRLAQGRKGKVLVGIGQISTAMEHDQLERLSAKEYRALVKVPSNAATQAYDATAKKLNFSHSIDVRGLRLDAALDVVSHYIDEALMVGASQVSILHGTGTGVLRSEIRNYLRTVGGIKSVADEHVERGGAGITVVVFE